MFGLYLFLFVAVLPALVFLSIDLALKVIYK